MSTWVADASVVVKWYVPETYSDASLRLLDSSSDLHVPDLLHAEVGNILWKKSRRGEVPASTSREVVEAVLAAPLRVHPSATLLEGALDVALRLDRTVYDGLYVALAVALSAPLVTADRRLFQALERSVLHRHAMWVEDLPSRG